MRRPLSRYLCFAFHRFYATRVRPLPLADIGEGIHEVELVCWHVQQGDTIREFQPLCDVRSDKATAEITSKYAGKVHKLYWEVGDRVEVGKALADVSMECAEDDHTVGDVKTENVENSKEEKGTNYAEKAFPAPKLEKVPTSTETKRFTATPAVRTLMKYLQIDPSAANLTGHITMERLRKIVRERDESREKSGMKAVTPEQIPQDIPHTKHKLSSIRQTMAARMERSLAVPSFTASDEMEMGELLRFVRESQQKNSEKFQRLIDEVQRKLQKENFYRDTPPPYRFSVLPVLIKAISLAMLDFPLINSRYVSGDTVEALHTHNIGVAVDTPHGLLVPNIKNVEKKSIMEIYGELYRLITLAKAKRLQCGDISGGTFTVSNIGSIGSITSQPIVVPPEVCILSLGRIQKLPRFDSDGVVQRSAVATMNCSADHRVLDGAYLVRFMNTVRRRVEAVDWVDGYM